MVDYPKRNLTGLVIGIFAYKANGITEEDGGMYYLFQIQELYAIFKTMVIRNQLPIIPMSTLLMHSHLRVKLM